MNKGFRAVLIVLYLLLCTMYLATGSARLGTSDAGSMYAVTRSLFTHHWFDADPCVAETRGNQCVAGIDGRNYSGYGILSSAIVTPAYIIGSKAAHLLHKDSDLLAGAMVSLANCFITPLISVLFCLWLVRLGYRPRVAVAAALTLGLATPLWYHGVKNFNSEPHFTLAFFASCYFLRSTHSRAGVWLAGLCFGLAVASRVYGLVLLPVLLWYLLQITKRDNLTAQLPARLAGFLIPLGVILLFLGWFNAVRFGSPLKSGYHLMFPTLGDLFATPLLTGLWGVLFNGEVGLIWFTPTVLLLPLAWRRFRTAHPNEAMLCLWVSLISILFMAKYAAWHGGESYGPRLLVPILPFLVMPLAALYEQVMGEGQRRLRMLTGGVVALAVSVQLLGMASSLARYYDLKEYYHSKGVHVWWQGSALLQNVDALPKLIHYRPQRGGTPLRALSQAEHAQFATGEQYDMTTAASFMESHPNSINLLGVDIWLFKASALGLPKALSLVAAMGLFAAMLLWGWSLVGKLRSAEQGI